MTARSASSRTSRATGEFWEIGFNVGVLEPGHPMAMYHWETDQEDFLVVSGEALLIVEGEERPLRAWDFVHCPPGTDHIIVGAGTGPVSSSPRARGSTRTEIGAATPSTRPHSVTGRVSRSRPRIPRRRMRLSRSGASRAIRRVGCLDRGSRGAARTDGERAAGSRRRLVRRQRPRCRLGRVGRDGRLHAAR